MEIDWVIVEQRSGTDEGPPSPSPQSIPAESGPTPTLPSAPGCYFKQLTSSARCGGPFLEWEQDTWGEENAHSSASETSCIGRKSGHDSYCGVSTEWLFVGGGASSTDASAKPSPTSDDVLLDFEPWPCTWQQDLRSLSAATFEGVTIRSDGGVQLCKDCAQRCYAQMHDCVGFVMEPHSSNEPQIGKCTYFSRIDKIKSVENKGTLALTTAAQVDVLTA